MARKAPHKFIETENELTLVLETDTGKTYTSVYTKGIAYNIDKDWASEYVAESDNDERFIILRVKSRDSMTSTKDLRNPYEVNRKKEVA